MLNRSFCQQTLPLYLTLICWRTTKDITCNYYDICIIITILNMPYFHFVSAFTKLTIDQNVHVIYYCNLLSYLDYNQNIFAHNAYETVHSNS